jgi:phosphonate metabolism-associated iron-containing alcohol dehydrogenase
MNRDDPFVYFNPVHVHFAPHAYLETLNRILGTQSMSVGLFYGCSAMQELGVIGAIHDALPACKIWDYGSISPNPDRHDIEALLEDLPEMDWVIGIGGGSVLDVAKTVAFMSQQKEDLDTLLTHRNVDPPRPGLPFVAIPTTSGTGSEVTPWATVWDMRRRKKFSLSDSLMYPRHAVVDPALTLTVPPYVTAYTAFDALSQALEAFWSRFSNPISDMYAVEAIRLILHHLEPCMADLAALPHRSGLARASLYAGLAFSNTETTAVHAVSYPMTLHYGVPHGVACSLTLVEFWHFNLEAIDAGKVRFLVDYVGEEDLDGFANRITSLKQRVGLPDTLQAAGIPPEGTEVILDEGLHPEKVGNNPRRLTRDGLRSILERIQS